MPLSACLAASTGQEKSEAIASGEQGSSEIGDHRNEVLESIINHVYIYIILC